MATGRVELQFRTAIDNPTDTVSLFQKYVNATNHSYILAQTSVYFFSFYLSWLAVALRGPQLALQRGTQDGATHSLPHSSTHR